MKTIILHGSLKDLLPSEYNGRFECEFNTIKEAISAIQYNFGKKIHDRIREMYLNVVQGTEENGQWISEKEVGYNIVPNELHLIPSAEGAKFIKKIFSGVIGKILGAVLIGIAIFASGGTLAGLGGIAFGNFLGITGTQLLLAGASILFSSMASAPLTDPAGQAARENITAEQRPSSLYAGPINTQEQGHPVPYVAGINVIVGGAIIHTDIQIEDVD